MSVLVWLMWSCSAISARVRWRTWAPACYKATRACQRHELFWATSEIEAVAATCIHVPLRLWTTWHRKQVFKFARKGHGRLNMSRNPDREGDIPAQRSPLYQHPTRTARNVLPCVLPKSLFEAPTTRWSVHPGNILLGSSGLFTSRDNGTEHQDVRTKGTIGSRIQEIQSPAPCCSFLAGG